jgi:hypothetical protein
VSAVRLRVGDADTIQQWSHDEITAFVRLGGTAIVTHRGAQAVVRLGRGHPVTLVAPTPAHPTGDLMDALPRF